MEADRPGETRDDESHPIRRREETTRSDDSGGLDGFLLHEELKIATNFVSQYVVGRFFKFNLATYYSSDPKKNNPALKKLFQPRQKAQSGGQQTRTSAAALARFDQQKKSEDEEDKTRVKAEDEAASDDDLETASEDESGESDAVDIKGKRFLDSKGPRMIKVCEDENPEDGDA